MFTLVAYYESQDGAAALHLIAAVPDQHITVQGDDIRVPRGMNKIIGHAVLSSADTALTDARIETPTLRRVINLQIGVLINALTFGKPPEAIMHPLNPTPLTEDESMNLLINSDDAAGSGEYGLVWFSDGPQTPVMGEMYTIRATGAASLVVGTWVNTPIVLDQVLPVGTYAIVGMRAQGTNLVAARTVIPGELWRPGVPAVNVKGDEDTNWFRYGRMGSFGQFHSTTPPTIDCMGVTDTTQVFWFDLMKIG